MTGRSTKPIRSRPASTIPASDPSMPGSTTSSACNICPPPTTRRWRHSGFSPGMQASAQRARRAGQNMPKVLALVADFRNADPTAPLVLRGYYNPISVYGVPRFLIDVKAAGVDGLIVVDLPPEEDDELCLPALKAGLNFIRLATPTTDDRRLAVVLPHTPGLVYYLSITGITGTATPESEKGTDST